METTTVNKALVQEVAVNVVKETTAKAVKESREKKPIVKFDYNCKSVVIGINGELQKVVTSYYVVRMHLVDVTNKHSNNIDHLNGLITKIFEKDEITNKDMESLEKYQESLAIQQACYGYFKGKINAELKEIFKAVPESLYHAYVSKFMDKDNYKAELSNWLDGYGVKMSDSFYDFIERAIGLKSSGQRKRIDNMHIDTNSRNAFNTLLFDILTQLAIDKNVMHRRTIEEITEGAEVEIKEFMGTITIKAPTIKTTVKDYKAILDEIGVGHVGLKNKDEFIAKYQESKKNKLFAEYN